MIDTYPNESLISREEIAESIYATLNDYINNNLGTNKVNNKTFEQIKNCKEFFVRLGKPKLYDDIVCYLYLQSLQLSLKGIKSSQEAYEISHNIFQYFESDENRSALFDSEEKALYIWAKDNISDRDLYVSDDQYNAILAYTEEYSQIILGVPYDDDMYTSSLRLQYAYVLNKLRHNEFADDYYEIDEAKNHLILSRGEKIVWVFSELADIYQCKVKGRYVGTSTGISLRIAKGLYVRTGGYEGQSIEEQSEDYLGCGNMVITTESLICYVANEEGHSVRIPFDKIVSIKYMSNGFVVEQGDKRKDIRFEFYKWRKEDYTFMLKVMQTDCRELGSRTTIQTINTNNLKKGHEIKEEKPKKQSSKRKSTKNKDIDLKDLPFISTIPLSRVVSDDKLRNKCFAAVDNLFSFYQIKCYESKCTAYISQVFPPTKEYLDVILLHDLFQCIIAVNGKVDVSTPPGIIAIMAIGKTQGLDYSDLIPFFVMTKKVLKSLQTVADTTLNALNSLTGVDTFFFSTIFSLYSKQNQKKYVDLMIQITNCLIEIENTFPDESAKFLAHLEAIKPIPKGKIK